MSLTKPHQVVKKRFVAVVHFVTHVALPPYEAGYHSAYRFGYLYVHQPLYYDLHNIRKFSEIHSSNKNVEWNSLRTYLGDNAARNWS